MKHDSLAIQRPQFDYNTNFDDTTLQECALSNISKMKQMRQDLRGYHQYAVWLGEEIKKSKNQKWTDNYSITKEIKMERILNKNNPSSTNNPPPLESINTHDNDNNKRNVSGGTLNLLLGAASSSKPRWWTLVSVRNFI